MPCCARADQIEVVDLAPQALRDRLAAGLVYPADAHRRRAVELLPPRQPHRAARARAALARRRGRQRAAALPRRARHRQARGRRASASSSPSPAGRRARRCCAAAPASPPARPAASCSPCTSPAQDGLARRDPGGARRAARARRVARRHATTRSSATTSPTRSSSSPARVERDAARDRREPAQPADRRCSPGRASAPTVIRASGDIDVHIVTHARGRRRGSLLPPQPAARCPRRRRVARASSLALVGGPAADLAARSRSAADGVDHRARCSRTSCSSCVVALVGGIWPAAVRRRALRAHARLLLRRSALHRHDRRPAAPPRPACSTSSIALLVSVVVDQAARRTRVARARRGESELLADDRRQRAARRATPSQALRRAAPGRRSALTAASGSSSTARCIGDRRRRRPRRRRRTDGVADRTPPRDARAARPARWTPPTGACSTSIVAQLGAALEHARPHRRRPARLAPLAEADRVRTALLAAVGHDLRRPLAVGDRRGRRPALVRATGCPPADRARAARDRGREPRHAGRTWSPTCSTSAACRRACSRCRSSRVDVADVLLAGARRARTLGPDDVELDARPTRCRRSLADPVLLQRVLVNLLANAHPLLPRRARRARARDAAAFGDRLQVRVIDHGPGIAERAARRDVRAVPAPRRHRQHRRPRAGARAVEGLRRGHGRHARARGHPGRRAHDGASSLPRRRRPCREPASAMKILIADDDPQILRALRITLDRARLRGRRPRADGARGASTLAAHDHPDLVMLDLGMPRLDGVEVIEALRGWTTRRSSWSPAAPTPPTRSRRSTPAPTTT